MKALGDAVMRDPAASTPIVQAAWGAWEAELLAAVAADREAGARGIEARVETLIGRQQELLSRLTPSGG
jgi:hypothetical protein